MWIGFTKDLSFSSWRRARLSVRLDMSTIMYPYVVVGNTEAVKQLAVSKPLRYPR
jgi:hypothetical protein